MPVQCSRIGTVFVSLPNRSTGRVGRQVEQGVETWSHEAPVGVPTTACWRGAPTVFTGRAATTGKRRRRPARPRVSSSAVPRETILPSRALARMARRCHPGIFSFRLGGWGRGLRFERRTHVQRDVGEGKPQRRRDAEKGLARSPLRLCVSVVRKRSEGPHVQRWQRRKGHRKSEPGCPEQIGLLCVSASLRFLFLSKDPMPSGE
jgi:hypothetical protein